MAKGVAAVPDELLYAVCKLVLRDRMRLGAAGKWLERQGYPATREWPRQILLQAYERGILEVPGREHHDLGYRLMTRTENLTCRVAEVVKKEHDAAVREQVAALAAEHVLTLIDRVYSERMKRHPAERPEDREVHLGFSAGGTSDAFARHLALMLEHRDQKTNPSLVLHTLTSGFFTDNPETAPVVSLGHFTRVLPCPQYRVLFSEPLASQRELAALRRRALVRDAFAAAPSLDIVVTSISVAGHQHSLFSQAIKQGEPERGEDVLRRLSNRGWAGDIGWRPYDGHGSPLSCEPQPVSVLEFQDLVTAAQAPGRHVVCIAGPCITCGEDKSAALKPLLECAARRRPFNHLITTAPAAATCCERLGW